MLTEVYLRQEYYGKRRSLNQIGAEHGVSPAAVAYWMAQFDAVSYTKKTCRRLDYKGTVRIAVNNVKLLNLMRQWHKELIEGLNGGLRLTGKASVLKTDAR